MEINGVGSGLNCPPVSPCKENICAIVVTHFPSEGFRDRVIRARQQVGQVVIVDNATEGEAWERVKAASDAPGINLIQNSGNLGIGAALNRGVSWAQDHAYKWVLLLDDDTVPAPDMVATLIRAFEEFPDKNRLAVIGSNRILNLIKRTRRKQSGWWSTTVVVISSGSLIDLSAAQKIGCFREEFFMDFVDFEFCLRARSKGFKIVEVMVPTMQHFVGDSKIVRRLGLRIHTFNHQPWHSYYKMRNFIFVIREYLLKDPWWVIRMCWAMSKTILTALLIEEARISKLKYTLLGFYDGLFYQVSRKVI